MQRQIDTYGTDPQVVEEVSAGTVPDETPEDFAGRLGDATFQLQDRPDLEIDVKRLRTLYVTSTISWQDFKTKYIAYRSRCN